MKKNLVKRLAVSMMMVLLLGTTMPVYAQTMTETEQNGTRETAEIISANSQTPEEYVDADNSNTFVVKGSVSTSDTDWFKVYLNSQDKYFSIYSDLLYYQIFDSNGNPVTDLIYETDATSSYHVYDYSDFSTGYYYICLTSEKASSSYQFLFGSPVYRISKIVKEGTRVSLSSANNQGEDIIDFAVGECPEESQVYMVAVNGVNSSYASKVEVEYSESTNTFSETSSGRWTGIDVPLSYGYGFEGAYTFTYTYGSSAKTFTPSYSFYYVYPLLP